MLKGALTFIALVLSIVLAASFVLPQVLNIKFPASDSVKVVNFHANAVMQPTQTNLNITHPLLVQNPIWEFGPYYYIDASCSPPQGGKILYAIDLWQAATSNYIDFIAADNESSANLIFRCVDYYIDPVNEEGTIHATLGQTFLDSDFALNNFTLIQKVDVVLGKTTLNCTRPIRVMHEIGHALGLAHTDDKSSILYPYVDCNQKFTSGIVDTVKELYGNGAVPQIFLGNVSSTWSNGMLSMKAIATNLGGRESGNFYVNIETGENVLLNTTEFPSIFIGDTRQIEVDNISVANQPSDIQIYIHTSIRSKLSKSSVTTPILFANNGTV